MAALWFPVKVSRRGLELQFQTKDRISNWYYGFNLVCVKCDGSRFNPALGGKVRVVILSQDYDFQDGFQVSVQVSNRNQSLASGLRFPVRVSALDFHSGVIVSNLY